MLRLGALLVWGSVVYGMVKLHEHTEGVYFDEDVP